MEPASGRAFSEVLAAAIEGDGPSFDHLYRSLNRQVVSFARARGASDPEGLVNDVFLKAFTNLAGFDGTEAQFQSWIFQITRNQLIDESRKRARRPQEVPGELVGTAERESPDSVEHDAISHLGEESLHQTLMVLTPEQRDVVLLRVVSDLSIEAVAEVLGKSIGAVKSMQLRAFRTLAKEISAMTVSP